MDFNQIITDLKSKKYKPVYFLSGEEPYYIDQISDYIENNVLDESEKEFNQTVIYGRDVDVQTIIGAAKRFPMMSEYQVVIVKEAQNIKNLVGRDKEDSESDEGKDASKNPLVNYVENPQKSTILVFCYKYKTVDKRTAAAKALAKHAVLFESKKIYADKLPDWINNYLKPKQYTINPKAAFLMAEYLGNDLSKISNELDKLMINVPPKNEITTDHIQNNIGISKDFNTFELQNALGMRDVLKANRIINYFGSNTKDHPLIVTLTILNNFFSKLLLYHSSPDKSRGAIAAAMGVNPFFVGDYEKAAKNYSMGKIKNIISYLREYDLKSKGVDSNAVPEGELLKELVFKILH